ncbi:P1 family peptidase [Propionivibrio soli]|uniref:DmpA family aminopeptidase n=1 Tax=Propionivibrio soli TaxID=2976531 RepID=UPI0021E88B4C|nr:P1 family peptidase [Propionivibrio soli]
MNEQPAPEDTRSLPRVGQLPPGPRNSISDVGDVRVGHLTLAEGAIQTGVTVVAPHGGDPFIDKVPAAVSVINGFGKSVGLVQLEELGVLETPIALTNTFAVGTVAQAQIRAALEAHPRIGREWPTVNPLVLECNDGYLNDIRALAVCEEHYGMALAARSTDVAQGSVGAGRGMSAFDLKGGIGTASRRAGKFTVGALVLANFGRLPMLILDGDPVGRVLAAAESSSEPEQGSIIMLLATDAPLDARQLRRLARRAGAGLARTGSHYGHGSGDIVVAFSTAYTIPQAPSAPMPSLAMLHESRLDPLFAAAAEATEQAIVNALWHAEPVGGRDGNSRRSLRQALAQIAGKT